MRIAIIAMGSRGDIQPYIALGKGLKAAGHIVRLITHENFEALVSSYGLEFCPVKGNVQEFMETLYADNSLSRYPFPPVHIQIRRLC